MKLSILICTVSPQFRAPERLISLLSTLDAQTNGKSVEVLYLGDNKRMNVGQKRNQLLRISSGERIVFIDDDDRVAGNYVDSLLSWADLPEDVIAFGVQMNGDRGTRIYDWSYKKNINERKAHQMIAGRVPNHLCMWKRNHALRHEFPLKSLGEDHIWAEKQLISGYTLRIQPDLLYFYDFSFDTTLCRRRRGQ